MISPQIGSGLLPSAVYLSAGPWAVGHEIGAGFNPGT